MVDAVHSLETDDGMRVNIKIVAGRVVSLEVMPPDGGDLTGKAVRSMPLGALIKLAREKSADRGPSKGADSPFGDVVAGVLRGFGSDVRARDRTDTDFARLADQYLHMVERGDRSPSKTLATRFAGTPLAASPRTWSNRIAEARSRGLLSSRGSGEAGGELSETAHRLLFAEDELEDGRDSSI